MKSFFLLLLLFVVGASLSAAPSAAPSGLLTNLLTHPEKTVITDATPAFGWIVPTTASNDTQSAYRILVATDRASLLRAKGTVWDSGKIKSAQSLHLPYTGPALAPNQSYWWTVRTWNRQGRASAFAEPQRFNTGNFDRSAEKWPGASLWVQLPDAQGKPAWTFEDRHPIAYHENAPVKSVPRPDGVTFLDFSRAAFAYLSVELTWSPAASEAQESTIEIAVGERALPAGDKINTSPGGGVIFRKYPLKIRAGTHTYTVEVPRFVPKYPHSQAMPPHMPEVVPFRYAEIRPAAARVSVVSARQLALWSEFNDSAASFASASADLDAVYELCRYSLKVNTFNGDYASSERERMMYEADTYIQQMAHYAVDREFTIARYSVANMLYHGSWPTEWISHCALMAWADYQQTGDASFLARYYDTLRPKTLVALAREDGLISARTGKQSREFLASIHAPKLTDIVDWPTHMADGYDFRDYNTVVNAFHYRSLVVTGIIATTLGKTADAADYAARAARVYSAFQSAFFDAKRQLYVDGIGSEHVSLHANLFALAFDLVPAEHRRTVIDYVKSRGMACGVYPAHYLLGALYDHGEPEAALALLTATNDRGWLNMIRMGSTVTTEAWDMKFKHNISWTHAWSASPAHIIPNKLMGIEPAEPGFGRVTVRPQLASLETASVKLPTIRGDIRLSVINRPAEAYALDLTLPANVTAAVSVPVFSSADNTVLVNGKKVTARRDGAWLVLPALGAGRNVIIRQR